AAGGRPEEVRARYALALSITGLHDPELDALAALRAALRDAEAIGDVRLEEAVGIRLIFSLVNAGRAGEAIATYDALHERFPLEGVHREEIERAQRHGELSRAPSGARAGRLRFRLAADAPEGTLRVTPAAGAVPDAEYEALPIR